MNKSQIESTFNVFQNIILKLSNGQLKIFLQCDVNMIVSELTIMPKILRKNFHFTATRLTH